MTRCGLYVRACAYMYVSCVKATLGVLLNLFTPFFPKQRLTEFEW